MVVVVARASGEGPPPAPVEARHQHKNMYCLLACLLFADAAVKEEIHRKMAYWPAAKQARLPRFFFFPFFLHFLSPLLFFSFIMPVSGVGNWVRLGKGKTPVSWFLLALRNQSALLSYMSRASSA